MRDRDICGRMHSDFTAFIFYKELNAIIMKLLPYNLYLTITENNWESSRNGRFLSNYTHLYRDKMYLRHRKKK